MVSRGVYSLSNIGGDGYGGSGCWASGGGGGYTMISKKTAMGSQALMVAAGGGGGASLNGLPGAALEGVLAGTLLDPLNGTTATVDEPGKGGESGSTYNAAWCATPGQQWQGGNGCEFGAGGNITAAVLVLDISWCRLSSSAS